MALPQHFSTNIRVLVIDHDINLLNTIQNVCYQCNYPVNTCYKVSDALNLLWGKKDIFDLVLIEAKMPDMDSYGFLRYVTQQINIPVIMMCDDGSRSVVMKAIDDGACDFWIKPLIESLIMNLWQHVARKLWKENKNLKLMSEELEVEGVINSNVEQEILEKNNNDKPESSTKKTRFKWSPELKRKFVRTVVELNIDKATPKKILAMMNEPGLTREHVASHLQKYRDYLKGGETKKQNKTDFSHQHNNFIPPEAIVNAVPIKFYQTDSEEETSSSTSINQHQDQNIFLAWHDPSPSSLLGVGDTNASEEAKLNDIFGSVDDFLLN